MVVEFRESNFLRSCHCVRHLSKAQEDTAVVSPWAREGHSPIASPFPRKQLVLWKSQ